MIRLTEAWFEFAGKRSDGMGILLSQMPVREHPAARYTGFTVKGRSGVVRMSDGAFDEIEVSVVCDVPDGRIDAIAAWLTGSGLLRFSDEPDRAYEAHVVKAFKRSNPFPRFSCQRFTVIFSCQPFRLLYPAAADIAVTASGTALTAQGTAPARPRIAITGSGDFTLTIGRQSMDFTGISGGVIVDSELMDALTPDGAGLLNNCVAGDFFAIDPAYPNTVSWALEDGAEITRVVITPRWRFI